MNKSQLHRRGPGAFGLALLVLCATLALPSFAQAQAEGVLEVVSNAEGALVYVDGELRGPVPLMEVVSAGYHEVRVYHPSYNAMERTVLVNADTSVTVDANLDRIRAGLSVTVDVPGARILLDGKQVGQGDVLIDPVRPGRHVLTVETEEYGRYRMDVVAKDRRITPVDVKVKASQGALTVTSKPAGARVILDTKPVGKTPITIQPIRPGLRSVKVVAAGSSNGYRGLQLDAGEKQSVHFDLGAEGGVLDIRPNPSVGRVSLDGYVLGEGAQRLEDLSPGSYSIRVTAPGHMDYVESVEVVEGKVLRLRPRLKSFDGSRAVALSPFSPEANRGPVHERPAFWMGVGGGTAVLVAIIAGVASANSAETSPGDPTPTGTPAPAASHTFSLP